MAFPIAVTINISAQYWVFAVAGVISLLAFVALILVPAVGSYGRVWERMVAGTLSLLIFVSLVACGIGLGAVVIRYWDDIVGILP